MPEPQSIHVVAGCVLQQHQKYLLVQEKQPKAYGLWNLPAGRVDVGETIEEAAVREVHEETGYQVELGPQLPVEHADMTRPVLHAFQAHIVGGELQIPQGELLDAKWFSFAEIKALQVAGKLRNDWIVRSIEATFELEK